MPLDIQYVTGYDPKQIPECPGAYQLFTTDTVDFFENQITKVFIGCMITIPKGYIPYIVPNQNLVEQSCLISMPFGEMLSTDHFNYILLKKGSAGKVRVKAGEPLAILRFIKCEEI